LVSPIRRQLGSEWSALELCLPALLLRGQPQRRAEEAPEPLPESPLGRSPRWLPELLPEQARVRPPEQVD
jgi:hypothetical protein